VKYPVYITLLILVSVCACEEAKIVEPITVNIDQLYTLELPGNLQPGYDMHDYAGLQYYDTSTDFYILGIEDAKSNLGTIKRKRLRLKGYYEFVENTVFSRADSTYFLAGQEFQTSQGVRVRTGDYYVFTRHWGAPHQLFYRIAVYESEDYFFQIVTWMPFDLYCDRYDWIERISYSFRLVEPAPSPTEENGAGDSLLAPASTDSGS